jgi:hypothetical protein
MVLTGAAIANFVILQFEFGNLNANERLCSVG